MFCPRCGRAVNENANFCGGCGLSRIEIEKYAAAKVAAETPQPAQTPDAQPTEVPFGTVANEAPQPSAAQQSENCCGEDVKNTVADILDSASKAETAKEETEAPKAESVHQEPKAESVHQEPKTESTYSYTAPKGAEYHYSAADGSYQNVTQSTTNYSSGYNTQYTAANGTQPAVKNENLSTVDFIWMLLISSIPVVGLIYLIYLAIQDNNTNKRSYARATLIIGVFAIVVSFVFLIGFIIAGL